MDFTYCDYSVKTAWVRSVNILLEDNISSNADAMQKRTRMRELANACTRGIAILFVFRGERGRCESILTRSALIEKQPWRKVEEERNGGAQQREGKKSGPGFHLLFRVLLPCVNIGHTT